MSGFTLYFAGAEAPVWRKLLLENGVHGVAISFKNLVPRLPKTKPYDLAQRYPGETKVLIDSGAYGARMMTRDDAEEHMRLYRKFVEDNEERITLVTEFDHQGMGQDWIERWREDFWDTLPEDKFMPVWHVEQGPDALEELATRYPQVAVVGDIERVQARLNGVVARHDVKLHGAAITKPDLLTSIRFASASSTSWISPMKFGDTIVWDGHRLRRYPKAYKDQARKRHRMLFERAGFDAEAIQSDDPTEVARMTVWSWIQQEAAVARRRGDRTLSVVSGTSGDDLAADPPDEDEAEFAEIEESSPTEAALVPRNNAGGNVVPAEREDSEKRVLPTIGFRQVKPTGEDDQEVHVPVSSSKSLRRCDSCYVAGSCPAMKPGSECAFELPLEIRTKDQLLGTLTTMLEMQAARVAFGRFAEELEGGMPDPNVSSEMDRFFKMTALLKEIQDNRDFLKIQVEAKGNAGVLSAIFGDKNGQAARELPAPIPADQFDRRITEIIDVE